MARKFRVWLNSGANIHSKYETVVDLADLGVEDDWDDMPEGDRDEIMRDIAFDRSDWGYEEINKA